MLKNLLSTCGLNNSEQEVLLCLLEHGPNIASMIAQRTKLKRPTVYAALQTLTTYGLAVQYKQHSISYFAPIAVSVIPEVLQQRAARSFEEVKRAGILLEKELARFEKQESYDLAGFEVVAIESRNATQVQLEKVLLGGDFCGIFNPQRNFVNDSIKQTAAEFLTRTSKTMPAIREIAVAGPLTSWYKGLIKNPRHALKELPAHVNIFSDMIFLKGSVYVFRYDENKEMGIQIKQEEYFHSMMAVFERLWETL